MKAKDFVKDLRTSWKRNVVHYEPIKPNPPRHQTPNIPLLPQIKEMLKTKGIEKLYTHQAAAIDAINEGKNVLCSTPTSSGKSLVYNIPVFSSILKDPGTKSLYLFPLKALGQDQLKAIKEFTRDLEGIRAEIYDGDTSSYKRSKIRQEPPPIIITNPDMLHLAFLPYHQNWEEFFRHLRFVVIDELHTYRGIFGSHFTHIIRRLRRICRHYGSDPQFIASSATIANPGEFARNLTGCPFEVIEESGAPSQGKHFLIINPQDSPYLEATRIFIECLNSGLKTITFTKARKIAELIQRWSVEHDPGLYGKISSYRAGYLAEERREIEQALFKGELLGVISTSALELGIDIGGLDACILVGYPGSITSTWQRAGRVGRGDKEALIIMIALSDALDQYFAFHPRDFFNRKYENVIIDPKSPKILGEHLVCSAAEIPLTQDDKIEEDILEDLEREGRLQRKADEAVWFSRDKYPQRQVSIRSIGEAFLLINEKGNVIGTMDGNRVLRDCHEGAIYLHKAEQYEVTKLDLENRKIHVHQTNVGFYTQPDSSKEIEILRVHKREAKNGFAACLGQIRVTEKVVGFERKDLSGQYTLSAHRLNLPPQVFETVGLWIEVDSEVKSLVWDRRLDLMGGLHAVEHATINLFPLFVMCDREDVGGISTEMHPQVGAGAIFIYDGYPGGIGLAQRAYQVIDRILTASKGLVEDCKCNKGCPSCIQSPKCGSNNRPLDKRAAILILGSLLNKKSQQPTANSQQPLPQNIEPKAHHPSPITHHQRLVFFDLETQIAASEVGGWQNKHQMKLALAVTYDSKDKEYRTYEEGRVFELIEELKSADLIIGFNIKRFDFEVLSGYSDFDFSGLSAFDILEYIHKRLGFRLSLGHLAGVTLGEEKLADGLQSIRWFREGKMDKIEEYCKHDVDLIRRLYEYGKEHGHLLYRNCDGTTFRVRVDW